VVKAPLPYSLRFAVHVRRVIPKERVEADVTGDIEGPAELLVAAHPDGSTVRLSWTMELRSSFLRAASLLGRPLMHWGHEWVVDNGVEAFRREALTPGRGGA
jgi:hypothetical protein